MSKGNSENEMSISKIRDTSQDECNGRAEVSTNCEKSMTVNEENVMVQFSVKNINNDTVSKEDNNAIVHQEEDKICQGILDTSLIKVDQEDPNEQGIDGDDVKEEASDFDAFSDGVSIHRKYQLRKAANAIVKKAEKNPEKKQRTHDFFKCPQCPKRFDSKTGLLNHTRMHQTPRQYICALCKASFTTNMLLIQHKVEHDGEDRLFLCKTCQMAFTDHCDFLIHEVSHSQRSSFMCAECGTYQNRNYIKLHIQSHFDRKVQCTDCGKEFGNNEYLKAHINAIHKEIKKVECVECGRLFKTSSAYETHLTTHTGVKKNQCLYCGQGFAYKQGRDIHTRIHTNEKPYKCEICNKAFHQQTDMQHHLRTHDIKSERAKFKCGFCEKEYTWKMSLRQHERLHKEENIYYCPICQKPCQNKQCLRVHMKFKHTTKKEFKCDLCNLEFHTKSCLTRHNNSKIHQRAVYGAKKKNQC